MSILAKLALFFVIVPLVELALLIKVGEVVGFWPTMGLVVFTGAAGAWLARLEGLRTMFKLRDDLAHGRLPGQAIMDGMAVLLGGALLLTPGIVTDLVGFSLLLPRTRRGIQRWVRARLEQSIRDGSIRMNMMGGSVRMSSDDHGVDDHAVGDPGVGGPSRGDAPTTVEQVYREAVYREDPGEAPVGEAPVGEAPVGEAPVGDDTGPGGS